MKKTVIIVSVLIIIVALSAIASFQEGPAPNSGDGITDGSGMSGHACNGKTYGNAKGGAPNSGDGVPDGSGF